MTTIVSLDPGGTTGYAVYKQAASLRQVDAGEVVNLFGGWWEIGHLGPEEHHKELRDLLFTRTDRESVIVCESFEFRQNRQRDNINLMSREYIGVVKLYRAMYGVPVVLQTAAQGKGFVSDEKLKAMDLWTPGKKHAMDAMRHLVFYMVNKQRRFDLIESWKNL